MDFKFDKSNIKWVRGAYGLPECLYKIKVPSVGSIIGDQIPDPDFDEFVKKVGKEKADQIMIAAGNRGTATHVFIENFIKRYAECKDVSAALLYTQTESVKQLKEDDIPDDKIAEGRDYFYKFYYSEYSNIYSNVIGLEMGIYSPTLFYRGKLDILYKHDLFDLTITDFKSSNGRIKKGSSKEIKYKYQIGGYAYALDEMLAHKNVTIKRATVLCIDKHSDILQEIELVGPELQEYKMKFRDIALEYHKQHNNFLI